MRNVVEVDEDQDQGWDLDEITQIFLIYLEHSFLSQKISNKMNHICKRSGA